MMGYGRAREDTPATAWGRRMVLAVGVAAHSGGRCGGSVFAAAASVIPRTWHQASAHRYRHASKPGAPVAGV